MITENLSLTCSQALRTAIHPIIEKTKTNIEIGLTSNTSDPNLQLPFGVLENLNLQSTQQSANQSTRQSANQNTRQSTNQGTRQSTPYGYGLDNQG